jgi:branched-chain amino acid transport system ATP-binding protein
VLLIDGVSIGVDGNEAVVGLSLRVGDGELVGLIGPSGAGKSTVLDAVTGLYRPSTGRIFLDDRDITRLAPHRIASLGVARTFQRPSLLPGLSVRDNVDVGRRVKVRSSVLAAARCWRSGQHEDARRRDVVEGLLQQLDLRDVADAPVGALPCGLRKRVELARALVAEPKLLLLDDLSTGMTIGEKEEVLGHLRRINSSLGVSILFASHDIGMTTDLCERVVALHQGRLIAEGPAVTIRQDHRVMSAYLDTGLVRD